MKLDQEVVDGLLDPEVSKALATNGPHGINVIPVSSIKIVDGNIWLINYFFEKTHGNVQEDSTVALVYWKGFDGHQIKAESTYYTEGEEFDTATQWIAKEHPSRTVKGVLVLKPTEVHDISIGDKV